MKELGTTGDGALVLDRRDAFSLGTLSLTKLRYQVVVRDQTQHLKNRGPKERTDHSDSGDWKLAQHQSARAPTDTRAGSMHFEVDDRGGDRRFNSEAFVVARQRRNGG